jgi:hypothetical protein
MELNHCFEKWQATGKELSIFHNQTVPNSKTANESIPPNQ